MPKKPKAKPELAEFAVQLRAYVEVIGAAKCAEICGVTRRTIDLWKHQQGSPNRATQFGVLALLASNLPPKIPPESMHH